MTKKIKAVIVDDEEGARESLANIISTYLENVEVAAKADSATTGKATIEQHRPDLVFLDIEMPFGNAFDLLEQYDQIDFDIIFVTAYDHYAIKAIKFAALDYLLKPVDIDELKAAVARINERSGPVSSVERQFKALLENLQEEKNPKKVAIPDTDGLLFVQLNDIIRCESDGNYTSIMLKTGKRVLASKTLGEYEELFRGDHFFRTHRSHLINLNHIHKYVKGEGGYVIMSDGSEIEISRRKKSEFIEVLSKGA